jgi:hypothetical protein
VNTYEDLYKAVMDGRAKLAPPYTRDPGKSFFDQMLLDHYRQNSQAKIMGMDVITSPLCKRMVPARVHKDRGEMHRKNLNNSHLQHRVRPSTYHKRIQKKWNKRFGFVRRDVVFVIHDEVLCMSPEGLLALKQQAARDFPAVRIDL